MGDEAVASVLGSREELLQILQELLAHHLLLLIRVGTTCLVELVVKLFLNVHDILQCHLVLDDVLLEFDDAVREVEPATQQHRPPVGTRIVEPARSGQRQTVHKHPILAHDLLAFVARQLAHALLEVIERILAVEQRSHDDLVARGILLVPVGTVAVPPDAATLRLDGRETAAGGLQRLYLYQLRMLLVAREDILHVCLTEQAHIVDRLQQRAVVVVVLQPLEYLRLLGRQHLLGLYLARLGAEPAQHLHTLAIGHRTLELQIGRYGHVLQHAAHHLIREVVAVATRHKQDRILAPPTRMVHGDALHIYIGHHVRGVHGEHQDLTATQHYISVVVVSTELLLLLCHSIYK